MSKRDRCIDPKRRHIHRIMRRQGREPFAIRLARSQAATESRHELQDRAPGPIASQGLLGWVRTLKSKVWGLPR